MAKVGFVAIFQSTATNQEEESSSFAGSRLSGATNISFTSQDPTAVTFSGNNVPGNLTYTLNGATVTVNGIVSRQFKSGSTVEGFYFIDAGSDYTLTSRETASAYLLVVPGQDSAFASSPGTYGTSSDPVDNNLNALLASQPTLVGITQNEADLSLDVNQTVLYTFSFSTDMDAATFSASDIANTGTAGVTFGAFTEVSPGVFTVPVTATSAGTINLEIVQDAVIATPVGLTFDSSSATVDNETLNVVAAAAPTIGSVTAEDGASAAGSGDNTVVEGNPLRYAVTLTAAPTAPVSFALAASGTAAAADYGSYTFSNGVTYDPSTGQVTVPAGVTSFSITVPTTDDTAVESAETLTLTVGGVAGTGDIKDNDLNPVFSAGSGIGDRWLSGVLSDAENHLLGDDTIHVDFFSSADPASDLKELKAWFNVLTGDYFYAPEGVAPPYACYVPTTAAGLGYVASPGQGAFDVHIYLNSAGVTELVGTQQAADLKLLENGFRDLGAVFASVAPYEPNVELVGVPVA